MSIGIAGAHRTGKTTLAKKFAEETGMYFLKTSASATFERLGRSPKLDYDFETRLEIQSEILSDMMAAYAKAPKVFIADRTPIDLMAYTIADVQRETIKNEKVDFILRNYLETCIEVTTKYFNGIVVLQPGIPVVEENGKAPGNYGYIAHINYLVVGITLSKLHQNMNCLVMHDYVVDLGERIETLKAIMAISPDRATNAPSDQKKLS